MTTDDTFPESAAESEPTPRAVRRRKLRPFTRSNWGSSGPSAPGLSARVPPRDGPRYGPPSRAEELLRAAGRDDLAAAIRADLLPHGVVDEDRWSYDVPENFQSLLAETRSLERRIRRELADGNATSASVDRSERGSDALMSCEETDESGAVDRR